jgi:hypothetical protein
MVFIRFTFLLTLVLGCKTSPKLSIHERLKGHWHMVKGDDGRLTTLDISDSTSTLNQYSMLGFADEYYLFDSTRQKILLPQFCGCGGIFAGVEGFYLIRDSLVYDTAYSYCLDYKFVKRNSDICRKSHLLDFSNIELFGFPLSQKRFVNWDSLMNKTSVGVLIIGNPKNEVITDRTLVYPELDTSPRIQAGPVYITIKEIPIYVRRIVDSHWRPTTSICLAVDSSVSDSFVRNVIQAIPKSDSINLFRLVKAGDTGELGYEKLN